MTDTKPYRPIEPVYKVLASLIGAYGRCLAADEVKTSADGRSWETIHRERIERIIDDHLPSGAGWDCGTKLDFGRSTDERLVFYGEYRHMNDNGYYDGWTDHTVTVRPSLQSQFTLSISGRNRNDVKDYLHELFDCALRSLIQWDDAAGRYVSAPKS